MKKIKRQQWNDVSPGAQIQASATIFSQINLQILACAGERITYSQNN